MAKLTTIPRKRRGPSYRGRVMIDTFNGTLRVRKWPKKYGKARSAKQQEWIDWFTQANRLAKYASAYDQRAAIEGTKGSGLYPRDVILKAMRGRLYWWVDENGWKWYPMAAIGDISETLDVLAQKIGSVLVRAPDRWRDAVGGALGLVLTHQGPDAPPKWLAGGGAGPAFAGALVHKDANQSILNATFTNLSFQSEVYDTDTIHDPVTNNSRLTVPEGWTYASLSAGIRWASSNLGDRAILFRKNGALMVGISEHWKNAALNSEDSITSPPIAVVEDDYFEVRVYQNSGSARNCENNNNTYFAMHRLA